MRERKMIVSREKIRMVSRRNLHTKSAVRKTVLDRRGAASVNFSSRTLRIISNLVTFRHSLDETGEKYAMALSQSQDEYGPDCGCGGTDARVKCG